MELTSSQKDALTELINIGYGRAAGALSELTGHRVTLEVPVISMHPIEEMVQILADQIKGEVASVNQGFSGAISGNSLLMMDEKSALILSRLLSDDELTHGGFDDSVRETITEVGNILLNACLSMFGNLLHVRISFAVPRLQVAGIDRVIASIRGESEELQYGLMIHMHFQLRASNVTGYLIIILGIASLDRMLREVDNWEMKQTS
jgi:chemotaxis protein CheC